MYVSVVVSDVHEYVVEILNHNALLSKTSNVDVRRNGPPARRSLTAGAASDVSSMTQVIMPGFDTKRKPRSTNVSFVNTKTWLVKTSKII